MVRNKQRSIVVRLDALTHARLKAVASIEDRDMAVVVDRVLNDYFKTNYPRVLTEIVSAPEPSAPSSEPVSLPKAKGRKPGKK